MKALTLFALALTLLSLTPTFGQTKSIVGFYNVENLFDTLDTEGKNDIEFLPGADRKWNTQKYQEKITHINTVIETMRYPLILGLCEIENKAVVKTSLKEVTWHTHTLLFTTRVSIDVELITLSFTTAQN